MERHAIGIEAKRLRVAKHVDRHRRHAAELARQRPLGALAVGQDAAEHARAGGDAGDLLDLLDAVDREQPDAEIIGAQDVALLLDGVAEGDAVSGSPPRRAPSRLRQRTRCRRTSPSSEQAQDLRRRVRFHRVIDPGIGERLLEGAEIVARRHRGRRRGRGRSGRRVARKSRMRCVAIGLSNARFRAQSCCGTRAHGHADTLVKQRRDGFSWNQPVETPEP